MPGTKRRNGGNGQRTEGGEEGAARSKPLNERFSGRVQAGARGSGRVAQTVRTLQNLQRSTGWGASWAENGMKTASRSQRIITMIHAISTSSLIRPAGGAVCAACRSWVFRVCFIASARPALSLAACPIRCGQGAFLCRRGIDLVLATVRGGGIDYPLIRAVTSISDSTTYGAGQ